jgi:hypothetical protein
LIVTVAVPAQAGRIDATVAAPGPHDFAARCERYVRRANPPDAAASIATRATFRDDREASLMAARAERTSASDLPDGASNIFGFHEFVKTEFAPGRGAPRGAFACYHGSP